MKNIKRYSQLFENNQELTQEQKNWLDKCTKYGNWSVNPRTGLVDVDGGFDCYNLGLKDFKGVRFGQVSRNFNCSNNSLTSLEGAPQSVGGDFDCSDNELKSLEGVPQSVSGYFSCSHNELKSLEGLPAGFRVGVGFSCSHNELESLKGLPDGFKVGGYFSCAHNNLKSLKGLPDGFMVGTDFNCSYNEPKSLDGLLDGLPEGFSVGRSFVCDYSERSIERVVKRMGDKKISLEQAVAEVWEGLPEEDQAYLAKHNPDLTDEEKRIYRAIELNMKRR